MKAGDKVIIIDGSWSYKVVGAELLGNQNVGVHEKTVYTIVAIDPTLRLPTHSYAPDIKSDRPNNAIVVNGFGTVVFTHESFLKDYPEICPTCKRGYE